MVMKLEELIHGLDGLEEYEIRGNAEAEIGHLSLDNRKCVKNSLFFAIRGLETDGQKRNAACAAYSCGNTRGFAATRSSSSL